MPYQVSVFDVLEALSLESVQAMQKLFSSLEKEIKSIIFPYTFWKNLPKKVIAACALIRSQMAAIESFCMGRF